MDSTVKLIYFAVTISIAMAAKPGTFFWRPRLGLDLSIPTTESQGQVSHGGRVPTLQEIETGTAVLVDGYTLGTTVLALAAGYEAWEVFPHLNPFKAWFYTTAYRWALRHISLIPEWLQGAKYTFIDTHRAWRKRFHFGNYFIPKWIQIFLPHVWEFDREKAQHRRYDRFARPAFARHMRYPKPVFDYWRSEESTETIENLDVSDFSLDAGPDY